MSYRIALDKLHGVMYLQGLESPGAGKIFSVHFFNPEALTAEGEKKGVLHKRGCLAPAPPHGMNASEKPPPVVLTIAGFDPSSGAGVTADIKTIAAHGCYGVACLSAITVQST